MTVTVTFAAASTAPGRASAAPWWASDKVGFDGCPTTSVAGTEVCNTSSTAASRQLPSSFPATSTVCAEAEVLKPFIDEATATLLSAQAGGIGLDCSPLMRVLLIDEDTAAMLSVQPGRSGFDRSPLMRVPFVGEATAALLSAQAGGGGGCFDRTLFIRGDSVGLFD